MKKLLPLLFLALLLGLAFADLERPVLISYTDANWYVYVASSDYNYVFSARSDVTAAQLTDLFPESWAGVNKTVIGPFPLPYYIARNPRYVDNSTVPAQMIITPLPLLQANCTINQSISNRSNSPHTCASPRLQIYLPPGRLNLAPILSTGQENKTYRSDGFYYYIRSHALSNGTIGFTEQGSNDIVEFDFADPAAVTSELLWLSQTGIISNLTASDALQAGVLLSSTLARSADYTFSTNSSYLLLHYAPASSTISEFSWPQPARIDALTLRRIELPSITRSVSSPVPALPSTPSAQFPCVGADCPPPSAPACTGANCPPSSGAQPPVSPPSSSSPSAQSQPAIATPGPSAPSPASAPSLPSFSWTGPVMMALGIILLGVLAFYFRPAPSAPPSAPPVPEPAPILLSDSRMALLNELRGVERIPTDISERLGKSKATVVEQLDGLVQSGLVERVETPGRKFVFYRLTRAGRQALMQFEKESQGGSGAA